MRCYNRAPLWVVVLGQLVEFANADRSFVFSSPTSVPVVALLSSTTTDIASSLSAEFSLSSIPLTTTSWPTSLSFTSASVEWSPLIAPTPTYLLSQSQTTPSISLSTNPTTFSGPSVVTPTSQISSSWSETTILSSAVLSLTTTTPSIQSSGPHTSTASLPPTESPTFKSITANLNTSSQALGSTQSSLTATNTSSLSAGSSSWTWISAASTSSPAVAASSYSTWTAAVSSSSSTAAATSSWSTYPNTTGALTTISCISLAPGQAMTVFSYFPSAQTITVTLPFNASWANSTSISSSSALPTYCSSTETVSRLTHYSTSSLGAGASYTSDDASQTSITPFLTPHQTTTVFVSTKTSVTVYTSPSPPLFGSSQIAKQTVAPTFTSAAVKWSPLSAPPPKTAQTSTVIVPAPVSTIVGGVSVVLSPTQVVIGGQTINNAGGSTSTVVAKGQTFTVNPSQVIAPSTVLGIPGGGGVFMQVHPTTTVIDGVSVVVGPSSAVIRGSTYNIGAGAPEETLVVNGQSVSIGPQGVGFAQITVPPQVVPTNVVVLDGELISAIGSSLAVIGGTTVTYGPGISPQTDVIDGETIVLGPSGIHYGTTTLGGGSNSFGVQIGLAGGLTVSEIGSTLAVISGTTFVIGPGAVPTTAVINGDTITAGPSGIDSGGMTLSYPFNPTTQVITYGGITLTEVGSLVNIGGTTFTIGPSPTTDLFGSQTISIGPNGVGFKTTTFTDVTFTGSATLSAVSAAQTSKKNGAGSLTPFHGVLVMCMVLGIGINI